MSSTPQDTVEPAKQANLEALQPDNMDLIPAGLQRYATLLTGLTTLQHRILFCLVQNLTSENTQTQEEIADSLGIQTSTIWRARQNPQFGEALAVITRDSLRGIHDKMLGQVLEHGKKDWRALEFMFKYDGSYTPASKSLNVNANVSAQPDQPGSPIAYGMQVVENFIAFGYDIESLHTLIDKCYDTLREEGI